MASPTIYGGPQMLARLLGLGAFGTNSPVKIDPACNQDAALARHRESSRRTGGVPTRGRTLGGLLEQAFGVFDPRIDFLDSLSQDLTSRVVSSSRRSARRHSSGGAVRHRAAALWRAPEVAPPLHSRGFPCCDALPKLLTLEITHPLAGQVVSTRFRSEPNVCGSTIWSSSEL